MDVDFAEDAENDPVNDTESESLIHTLYDLYIKLNRNNRDLKVIDLTHYLNVRNYRNFIFNNRRAMELGIALRNNTVVENIIINVKNITLRGTGELVNYIVTSPSLKEFRMTLDSSAIQNRNEESQILAVVDRFLSAIAYRGNMKILHVPYLFGSIPLATALGTNHSSLKELKVHFEDTTTNVPVSRALMDKAEMVAGAVGALHNLDEINIHCFQDNCFTASTIHKLMNHPVLHKLVLELNDIGRINVPMYAYNLQDLFRSTTPLKYVELNSYSFEYEFTQVLPIILSGLYGHTTIQDLKLDIHTFDNENAIAVCDVLRNNQSIKDLHVRVDTLQGFALILECLENNETLSGLSVIITNASREIPANIEACRHFENSIASLKHLTCLEFDVERNPENVPFPQEIIRGVKDNKCLTLVDFDWEGSQITEEQRKLVNYYIVRNSWFPKLLNAATRDEVLNLFHEIYEEEKEDDYLSIVYETLRCRDIFW